MHSKQPSWLKNAIFYEIYPQSFNDSNADGIGDIPGIIQKLGYLQELGINAIWLNPCFELPFQDAGYDVADYYQVAARYGTNDDLKALFEQARKLGIRVILDLVPGHTSILHPWFQQSQLAEPNPYSDWYIWNDSVWRGSESDLAVIRGYAQRDGGYITNFFYCQPALNYGFAHPDPNQPWQQPTDAPGPQAVRQEMKNIMRYWLEMGASGFRVDMAASLVKRDPGKVETSRFWREVRTWLDQDFPEAVLISEWGKPDEAIAAGFHVDMLLGFSNPGAVSLFRKRGVGNHRDPYAWSFFDPSGHGNIREFVDEYLHFYGATHDAGYISLITGNHDDHPRLADGRDQRMLKVVYTFLLSMPGTPIIYYGDEIGMHYHAGLPSLEGGYVRTGVRTPMQWSGGVNAGFSGAPIEQLYLPIGADFEQINVANQLSDPDSLVQFVSKMTRLRKAHPGLAADGEFTPLLAEAGQLPFVYQRQMGDQRYIIAINPADKPTRYHLAVDMVGAAPELLLNHHIRLQRDKDQWYVEMEGVSSGILKV